MVVMWKRAWRVALSAGLGLSALAGHSTAELAIPAEGVVVDPWGMQASDVMAKWTPVELREVIEPWAPAQNDSRPSAPEIVDPWQEAPDGAGAPSTNNTGAGAPSTNDSRVPTRSFPPVEVPDSWLNSG